MNRLKIFISSTTEDLQPERDAVEKAVSEFRFQAVRAESIGAQPMSPRETCLAMARECDIYIGICGPRYGSIPPSERTSVTEMEFLEARNCKKDILIYVKEASDREDRQQEFIRRLEDFEEGYFRRTFSSAEQLGDAVQEDLSALVSTKFRRAGEVTQATDASTQLQRQHDEHIVAIDGLRAQLDTLAQRLPEREPGLGPDDTAQRIAPEVPPSVGELSTDELMRMGHDAQRQGLLNTALGLYEAVLTRSPDEPSALEASAWTRYKMYDYQGALSQINRARQVVSSEHMALVGARRACILAELGRVAKVRSMVEEALTIFRNLPPRLISEASRLYNVGNCLSSLGDCERAIHYYHRALELDAGDLQLESMIWKNLGKCHEDSSDLDEAKDSYEQGTQIDPSNWKAYVGLASLALKERRAADAVKAMEMGWKYVEPFPTCREMALEWRVAALAQARDVESIWRIANDYPEIVVRSAYIQRFLPGAISALWRGSEAHVPEALDFYLDRAEDFPEDESAWLELFNLHLHLGEQEEAAGVAERAIDAGYASAELRHQYGHLLHRMGRTEEAIVQLETAAVSAPSHHHSHCLALLHLERKDYENAAMRFEEARKDARDVVSILGSLGYCYFQLGRLAEARRVMQDLVAIEPDNARAWNNLGMCCQALGMWSEAGEAFERSETLICAEGELGSVQTDQVERSV